MIYELVNSGVNGRL